jgi:alanine racemase
MNPVAISVEKTNLRPTWAEVSLGTLRHNFRVLQDRVAPEAVVCAVVKAHAYGHGAVECALALEQEGAEWFGVTSTDEGMALRQGGVQGRVLLMTGFWRGDESWVIENDLTPAVWTAEHIQRLDSAATAAKKIVPVHLKIDSGMARLGVAPAQLPSILVALGSARHVRLEGVFTHFASAEVTDAPDVQAQIVRFEQALATVRSAGFSPAMVHMANSSAIATRPETWKNLVRPGIALYGYNLPYTSARGQDSALDLPVSPVLSWKTRIFSLRSVAAGQAIGYSGAYVAKSAAKIAALPVGYADGLSRKLSSRGRVIIRDEYAPIVGNISMDITLVDVTGIAGVEIGDEAIILGASEHCRVTAWDHARLAETIPYEILCNISKRVPRQYLP